MPADHIVGSTWARCSLTIKPALLSQKLSLLPAHGCLVFSHPIPLPGIQETSRLDSEVLPSNCC